MNYILTLERRWNKATYVIGNLYDNNGNLICNTLEDTDRMLDWSMPVDTIKRIKVFGKTAIPTGTYEITYTYSPKFKCNMPLLNNVKGYSAVRIHPGNSSSDTDGCILVGKNNVVGRVTQSRATFMKLNDIIKPRIKSGDKVYLIIKRRY